MPHSMKRHETVPLGVVVERRRIDNPWKEFEWRPVAVIPGAGPVVEWRLLRDEGGRAQYHMATMPLELYRGETDAYKINLSQRPPVVFVVLRPVLEDDPPLVAHLVTASPFEAQEYLDAGDDIIEGVPMPVSIIAWVSAFVDEHHVDVPFKKRKRKRYDPETAGVGRRVPPRKPRNTG